MQITKKNLVISIIIFILVLTAYVNTLAPTIYIGDSAELITASYTLGVAHPSGYPLYTIIAKLFTYLPFGNIAWKVNLMSAVFGTLTVSLLYLIIEKIINKKSIAVLASLTLAFSSIFWQQNLFAEVYTLNSFFVALLVLILINWSKNKNTRNLYWFSFLFGLSLCNHFMMILLAPVFAWFIILHDRQIYKNIKLIFKMFGFFVLGLLPYLYLPIRSNQGAEFLWNQINSWQSFWAHISRKQYGDFGMFSNFGAKLFLIKEFIFELPRQFLLPTFVAALAGIVVLFKKYSKIAQFTFGIFVFNSIVIILLRGAGLEENIEEIYKVYYLPAYMMVTIWLAVLFSWAGEYFKKYHQKISLVLLVILLLLPTYLLITNYKKNDLSNFWLTYDLAKETLDGMEQDSVLFYFYNNTIESDTELFNLIYLKMVENVRPDVTIISEHNFFRENFDIEFPKEFFFLDFDAKKDQILKLTSQIENKNLYSNYILNQRNNSLGYFGLSNGTSYQIYPNLESARSVNQNIIIPTIRNLEEEKYLFDQTIRKIIAHYYYNQAIRHLNLNDLEKSDHFLTKAMGLFSSEEYIDFLEYKRVWQGE